MPLMWALIIGLAAFRLYRLASVDSITEPIHGRILAAAPGSRFWAWITDLIGCAWCVGFWCSLILAGAGWWYGHLTPYESVVVAFAGSAICGLVARLDHLMEAHTP